jgi:hypothetical protein
VSGDQNPPSVANSTNPEMRFNQNRPAESKEIPNAEALRGPSALLTPSLSDFNTPDIFRRVELSATLRMRSP